ncbi:hypothetical protein K435DRAFT_959241 [Dendrothele bispora CBS 962.96]|uniref:Nucleoporin Nup82 n=1 Tax=Dendrothele bispora (strain CBS 962.96) TaxID=1314807 RepID=A0A4S8MZ64_DENBC|nr:hypothetical protein K435DRAFT_959241 [Dendrothele bispora CBS 962.96]
MENDDAPSVILTGHPIFSPSKASSGAQPIKTQWYTELSSKTLSQFMNDNEDGASLSGRRQVMLLRDTDLILAAGKSVRMSSLAGTKIQRSTSKSYKTLHTPNIEFDIHQIALNKNGKLLAVAGISQVAVIVLPRAGYSRLVPETIDCKSVQIGQFYHSARSAPPVAKIEWHPWGEGDSTLMVMTVDGKLREYDISVDAEEPQQVLSFVPERRNRKSFVAEDSADREVVSFTLGKGRADWGPLTVYALMRSGDIYSICPYMPQNASIPSVYVHSLECFIAAKQEYLSQGATSTTSKNLSTLYDYQHKYISALIKQLPPGTVFPSPSRSVLMHPPTTIKSPPARQGPFLLQPSPRTLEGSEGGDATDITYLNFSQDYDRDIDGENGMTENLGVVLITYQDGKVDFCLDVEKVEARWENKQNPNGDLPMLAVYETIDLGLVSMLEPLSSLDLLQGNYPACLPDPIHTDTIYVYHAFGVHALHLRPVLHSLIAMLHNEDDASSTSSDISINTAVQPILSTFSVERKSSNPVVAVAIPDDVYLPYSILVLTSSMRVTTFTLNPQPDPSPPTAPKPLPVEGPTKTSLELLDNGPPAYVSLLGTESWKPPQILSRPGGLPSNPRLSLPNGVHTELVLTPDTMRYLATTVAHISGQIHEIQLAHRGAEGRTALQSQELLRLTTKCRELIGKAEEIKNSRIKTSEARLYRAQEEQKLLIRRLDRMLQTMMEKASPELSEYETKWFEELKRMKEDVIGTGKYDEGSLATRTKLLEKEFARLMPSLKAMVEKEQLRKRKTVEATKSLGFSQAFELGERSNFERARISEVENDILKLAEKLDITLGRPAS